MADAGLKPADIDGIATAGETPVTVVHYLGLTPKWVDGTAVGGCSFMIHVRHAAAAIASGLCETVLITHGESGRSGVGRTRNVVAPTSLAGQFEQPYGPMGPPTLFTIPVLRYMKTYGLTHEQLAMVSVVQREWAAKNPRTNQTWLSILQISRPSLPSPLWLVRALCYSTSMAPSRQMDLKYWRDE
jgi:acetyl-CoA acetyltransferase